jgi:hypothetical protein
LLITADPTTTKRKRTQEFFSEKLAKFIYQVCQNNHSISQIFSSQQVKAEQRKEKSKKHRSFWSLLCIQLVQQKPKGKKLTNAPIMHLSCVKHLFGVDMGFVGLHIGSMGPVRPRSDPARLLQASSETICLPRLHQTPSRPQSASVLIYLGFNPNCSASVQTSRPFQKIWSISPSTQSVSASPSHLGLGLVLHDPSRLRQALLGPEEPSSDPICSSSVQTAPSLSDLPLFSPICSSLVLICSIPVRSAPL